MGLRLWSGHSSASPICRAIDADQSRYAPAVARTACAPTQSSVVGIREETRQVGEALSPRLRSRRRLCRIPGQSLHTDGYLERRSGFATPVQVQASEVLAQLWPDSLGQRTRPGGGLRAFG